MEFKNRDKSPQRDVRRCDKIRQDVLGAGPRDLYISSSDNEIVYWNCIRKGFVGAAANLVQKMQKIPFR